MSEPAGEPQAQAQECLAEYEERRRVHVRNYAIYMCSIFGALAAVFLIVIIMVADSYNTGKRVGAATRGLNDKLVYGRNPNLPPETPAWAKLAQVGLGVVVVVLGGFVLVSKRIFPIPLLCPQCEVRVDEIGLIDGRCPKCQVRLR
jgi:hypothetical protein